MNAKESKSPKAHVSEAKKAKVKELSELMKKKTVMIISIKSLPSRQFQEIKKKLRKRAKIMVAKSSLIDFALDHSGKKELHELTRYVSEGTAILFSDDDAFEISGILADNKSPAKAKPGQIAPMDIEVKAGPTSLIPGPDISALSAVGLAPKVEGGKIAVQKDKVIAKKGDVITDALASIMAKLEIIPFEVGITPLAACMDGKIYGEIVIDRQAMMESLINSYARALPFAIELAYVTNGTIDFILAKAASQETVISRIISGEPEPQVIAAPTQETKPEETKTEEKAEESAAGLASLFG